MTSQPTVRANLHFLGPGREELMDAHLPSGAFPRPRPAVVYFHGGGWSSGSRHDSRSTELCRTLAENGYAAFAADYALNTVRQGPDGTMLDVAWPRNFFDCKTAVRFVRKNAAAFGVDPRRIAVMGSSAGAHLALLAAATKDAPAWNQGGAHREAGNDVAAVVEFYGRFDLAADRRAPFAGATPEQTEANVAAASPATHLTPSMPPVLAIHGDQDQIVPVSYGRRLAERLKMLNVRHEYVEIPGAAHSFGLTPPQKDLRPVVLAFLDRHLKPSPAAST